MKKRLPITIAIIVILLLGAGTILLLNSAQEIAYDTAYQADFQANQADDGGVDTSSSFTIDFDTEIKSSSVRKYLSVSPEIDFSVHQGNSKSQVLVAPAEPLEQGTIYTFTLETEEESVIWAFETKRLLQAVDIFPQDQSRDILTSASIDIAFNQMTPIDLDTIEQYFTLKPHLDGEFSQDGRILSFRPANGFAAGQVYQVHLDSDLQFAGSDISLAQDLDFAFETKFVTASRWYLEHDYHYLIDEIPTFVLLNSEYFSSDEDEPFLVDIYSFDDGGDYQQILSDNLSDYPFWSKSYNYISKVDTATATLFRSIELIPQNSGSKTVLKLDSPLPAGNYLARFSYQGQQRDILFSVSSANLYSQRIGGERLFWLYDINENQPATFSVSNLSGENLGQSDNHGIVIAKAINDIYVIEKDQEHIVLPFVDLAIVNSDNYQNWRYLYLSQDFYEQGDELDFWGMVKPRDGSDLDYQRVSVYIRSESFDHYVYRGYTDLVNSTFSDSILLPALLDGSYTLEIWQSGLKMMSREFIVGSSSSDTATANKSNDPSVISFGEDGYRIGEEYQIICSDNADNYLFIKHSDSLVSYSVSKENTLKGVFNPENYLNTYISCVRWQNNSFTEDDPQLLYLSPKGKELQLQIGEKAQGDLSEKAGDLSLTITDEDGEPQQAQICVSMINGDSKPNIDTLGAIYKDYTPSAIDDNIKEEDLNVSDSRCMETVIYQSDSNGTADIDYQLPSFEGECWLVVQAISINDEEDIRAGSIVIPFGSGNGDSDSDSEQENDQNQFSSYTARLSNNSQLAANSEITIFASELRLDLLSLLFESVFDTNDDHQPIFSAEQVFAAAHARQLLLDYGGDSLSSAAGSITDTSIYQNQDGGIGNYDEGSSLPLSVICFATAPEDIDYQALKAYFSSFLDDRSNQTNRAMALCGLALYGESVLNDINLMLRYEDLSQEEELWLIWALAACGDRKAALDRFSLLQQKQLDLAGNTAVIAAIIAADFHQAEALSWLEQAKTDGSNYQNITGVIVARYLLPNTSQADMSFVYSHGSDEQTAQISGINDYLLKTDNEDSISFSQINGEIYYLNIY